MFINKITAANSLKFQGYQHVKDEVGDNVYRFNYPYDYENETCEIEFFKVKRADNYNFKLDDTPITKLEMAKDGIEVNVENLLELDKNEPFAYRFVRRDKKTGEVAFIGADTGIRINNNEPGKNIKLDKFDSFDGPEYSFVLRNGTTPKVQGASYLAYPDSQRVGVKYRSFDDANTGQIYIDVDEQRNMENVVRTFSNKTGGNLAGLEYNLDYLAQNGYKVQFANPIAGGDNKSSHHYWNKNNFQISDDMGNTENFSSYARKLFQKGILYVYDGTFTSEGLEGIHFQYALRWADKNPQSYYWFKMQGLKDQPLGLGVVPNNKENLRHRVVNAPVIFDEKESLIKDNPNYNPNKETFFQIYDASQVTEDQITALDKPIENYKNIKSGNALAINSHDDTLINYLCEINPNEYKDRLDAFIKFNKNNEKPIQLNSPDGTIFISQFSNFRIDRKTEGGFVTWDANTDMVKMNYHISGYDEKLNQSIIDKSEKDYEKNLRIRGGYEVQDMTLQAGRYWTKFFKDAQTLYTAQVLKGANSTDKINDMISKGLLPKEATLSSDVVKNILDGYYNLEPKGILTRKDATLKAIMQVPMDSLEFAENTVGVLSTSYFSNRATSEETLGLTRFELMQQDEPHLVEPYKAVYLKTNLLFKNDIKQFADKIIEKIDEKSTEKLLDEKGEYTEYGEYVINLVAPSIAKYAFLKALTGDSLKTKILLNGEITYDYKDIKEKTSLKSLGIKATNPTDEAEQLLKAFEKGLEKLDSADVDYVVKSISKAIEGTNVNSFRLAEAIVDKSSLGLAWRLDAAKDVMDQDAVRNGDTSFDESWTHLINFWSKFVQTVKAENPDSYIVAEITDVDQLMRDNYGEDLNPYANMPDAGKTFKNVQEAMMKFYNGTGITSEAAYSYFFTDIIKVFGQEFEYGSSVENTRDRCNNFIYNLHSLIQTRGIDYARNLFTFVGNHDKPRIIHGLAVDMSLFHGSLSIFDRYGSLNYDLNRKNRVESMIQLTNSDSEATLPLEARLNIDNPEYFKTVSTQAVAMSQLLRNSINDSLYGIADKDQIKYLKLALKDLTNGNYLDNGNTVQIPSITIPELSSFEKALDKILEMSNISLSKSDYDAIIAQANKPELINQYLIQGDFDWGDINANIGERNQKMVETLLRGSHADVPSGEWDYKKYSTYTVSVASILRQAFLDVKGADSNLASSFLDANIEFVKKYDRETVRANQNELPFFEEYKDSMAKNAYGSKDIKLATEMLVKQAEFIAQKEGFLKANEQFANGDNIVLNIWKDATEPAVQKASMMMTYLAALLGLPTMYSGDEVGMTGYEAKAKNVTLSNRNPIPWLELENGIFKDYRNTVQDLMNSAASIRNREGVNALNNGTAYTMKTSDDNIPAFMMQNGYGDITVSVFNAEGINTSPRFNYFEKYGITPENRDKIFEENNIESINKNNPYVPIQLNKEIDHIELDGSIALPIGLTFMNTDVRDKAKYVVRKIIETGKLGIFKETGKISLNSLTARNGAMILKNINFRGNRYIDNHNKKYNLVTNPYQVQEKAISGEKLSLVSR